MIERWKRQNSDCEKLHRCLPSQFIQFRHFLTEINEKTVDSIVIPEDHDDSMAEKEDPFIEMLSLRTVSRWKA